MNLNKIEILLIFVIILQLCVLEMLCKFVTFGFNFIIGLFYIYLIIYCMHNSHKRSKKYNPREVSQYDFWFKPQIF